MGVCVVFFVKGMVIGLIMEEMGRILLVGRMSGSVIWVLCYKYSWLYLYFYLIIRYDFGKIFNYKVVKNVIIDEYVNFRRIQSLFNILFNFIEFMDLKEKYGYEMSYDFIYYF